MTRQVKGMSSGLFNQLRNKDNYCKNFCLALDEGDDRSDTGIRVITESFEVFKELGSLKSYHGTINRGRFVFECL
jgi:hypothetical protein